MLEHAEEEDAYEKLPWSMQMKRKVDPGVEDEGRGVEAALSCEELELSRLGSEYFAKLRSWHDLSMFAHGGVSGGCLEECHDGARIH